MVTSVGFLKTMYLLTYLSNQNFSQILAKFGVGNQNKPFSMYKPSTYLAVIFMVILIPD